MRLVWEIFDNDHSRKLEKSEFFKFLSYLGLPRSTHEEIFKDNDTDKSGLIEYEEFEVFYKKLTDCSYLEKLFKQFATGSTITLTEFQKFMSEHQKEVDFSLADSIFLMVNVKKDDEITESIKRKLELRNKKKG